MRTRFHHLPPSTSSAEENMCRDLLILEAYPNPDTIRFRHYQWDIPCHTFGYTQCIEFIESQTDGKCIRRPTGGGMVNHANDWTWALVIPAEHPWCRMKASLVYHKLHESITSVLQKSGVAAAIVPCPRESCKNPDSPITTPAKTTSGVCFESPEIFDVIRKNNGQKIAGAAQKRNRHGLLVQGSISKRAASEVNDWGEFENEIAHAFCELLNAEHKPAAFPEWGETIYSQTLQSFRSEKWNRRR